MGKLYKFVTTEVHTFETEILDYNLKIKDKRGGVLARLRGDGTMIVYPGYAWDGCSPKWSFLDLCYIGTPDGRTINGEPILKYPSLVHDILYQGSGVFARDGKPFVTRLEADREFLRMMLEVRFKFRWVWFGFVRLCSDQFWGKRRKV